MKTTDTRKETKNRKRQIEATIQKQDVVVVAAASLPPGPQLGEEHLPITEIE